MNSKIAKILSIVSGILGLIAVYFLTRIIIEGDEAIESSVDLQSSVVAPYINFARIMLIITAIAALGFSLWNLIRQPKLLKKTLISVAVLGVLLAIAYGLASDAAVLDVNGNVLEDGEEGPISKWVSTGIWYSVILGGIGLMFFILDFVRSLAKN